MKIVIAPDSFKGSLSAFEVAQSIQRGIKNKAGAGAAGGLGADLVITGEGKIDFKTSYGKTPLGVAQTAKEKNIPVIALAGGLGQNYKSLYAKGFDGIFSITDKPMTLQEALDNVAVLLEDAAENLMRIWINNKLKKIE